MYEPSPYPQVREQAVVASFDGAPMHPAWLQNLRADLRVEVQDQAG